MAVELFGEDRVTVIKDLPDALDTAAALMIAALDGLSTQWLVDPDVDMQEGIFYAQLVFDGGAEVGARPSDSIALALRTGTRIVCAESVLDEAGLAVPAEQEDEVERFREFLDHVSPDDFEEAP